MIYPDGAIVEGGYVDASDNIPTIAGEGCTFIGVTFMNPARFGKGCTFVNCIFLDGQTNTIPTCMKLVRVMYSQVASLTLYASVLTTFRI